jgi:peptide/nickel transport system permease protein
MSRYIVRRLLQVPVIVVLVLTIIFFTLRLSGDPAALFVGQDATTEDLARVRQELGLNDPLPIQYVRFLADTLRGDFGKSLRHGQAVLPLLLQKWPASLQLAFASLLLSVLLGIPVGTLTAIKRGSLVDRLGMAAVVLAQGAPVFWIGVLLIVVFSVQLRWLPASGSGTLLHLVLPSFALGAFFAARIARFTRTAVIEVLPQDYIRTARAKGLPEQRLLWTHVARNAAIPVVTVTGLTLPSLIGGAVITEAVFSWPGVGNLIIASVFNRDYPVVQAGVFVIALFVLLTNIAVDLLYVFLDPRIRFE